MCSRQFDYQIKKPKKVSRAFVGNVLYFVRCNEFVKIGVAADLYTRLSAIQVGCPYEIELLKFIRCDRVIEGSVHRRFKKHRTRGEWFYFSEEIREFVAELDDGREYTSLEITKTKAWQLGKNEDLFAKDDDPFHVIRRQTSMEAQSSVSSRQFDYQIRKLRSGLCRQCGKRPIAQPTSTTNLRPPSMCEECKLKARLRHARNILERQRKKD